MDPATTRDALRRRLERAVAGTGAALAFEALLDGVPPYTASSGSALVEAAEQLLGAPSEAVAFATEAPYFGMLGIEALIAGPGDLKVAHQPDEALRLAAIPSYLAFLERMVERCCLRAA
jgi:acetylornithine deacetylase